MSRLGAPALVAALVCLAGGGSAWAAPVSPSQSAPSPPSLRLIKASNAVRGMLHRRALFVDPGVFVAAVGGDVELRAWRADYDSPVTFAQFDALSGLPVRSLPARLVRGFVGLRSFARVTLETPEGRLIASERLTFCPNADRQRVSDEGPLVSRYPVSCQVGFPFVRGMVWGVDQGWSASVSPQSGLVLRSRALRRGAYVLAVSMSGDYRQLLDVPEEAARVTVRVKVREVREALRERAVEGVEPRPPAPPARASSGPTAAAVPTLKVPPPETLPDLAALPAFDVSMRNRRDRNVLRFAANSWNAGPSDIVIEGFRRPGTSVMDAYQYFVDAGGHAVGRSPVGTLKYHAARGHEHWHLLQFAAYSLLDATGGRVVRARKQSFCLLPTDAVDLTVPRANWLAQGWELSSACGAPSALWVREALPVGWGDTYSAQLPGQSFDVTRVPNGRYVIRTEVNPLGLLSEQTTSNNAAGRVLRISGQGAERRVKVTAWKGIRG
jgi:hypothetical protein